MNAYLIDPFARQICTIGLVNDRAMLAEMRRLIGADDLDHGTISDMHDTIWVDGHGLKRGKPIHAFKLSIQTDPYAGKAIVIGADEIGRTRPPFVPLERLQRDVEWLGVIVPEVVWEQTSYGARAIVTYSRVQS